MTSSETAPATRERFRGCLLGLALGDALCAPHEGGPLERLVWGVMGRTKGLRRRWTDDTQMSLDLAESFIEKRAFDADDVASRFARSYRWSRGYGPGAAKLLKRIRRGADWREANRSVWPEGSLGNGGAMRVPVVALVCHLRGEDCADLARGSAEITHAHPQGVEGAVLVAMATTAALEGVPNDDLLGRGVAACSSEPFLRRLAQASQWLRDGQQPSPREVAHSLGNGVMAAESCVTAVYLAARFREAPFEDLVGFVAGCRGDADTIAAMAGAVWGAARGVDALPEARLARLEGRERIEATATELFTATRRG